MTPEIRIMPQSATRMQIPFFDTQLFPQQNCRCQRQEHWLHIIAERCRRDRRVPVRLKKQRPVEPHDAAGEQQNSEVFPDGRKIQVLTAHGKKQQQKHRSEQASRQRNQPGAERDVAHEQADRTENAQRDAISLSFDCISTLFTNNPLTFCQFAGFAYHIVSGCRFASMIYGKDRSP